MRVHRPLAAAGLVALGLTTAGCHSKSTAAPAPTSAAPSTAAAAASVAPAASAPASAGAPAASAAPASAQASSAQVGAAGSGAVTFSGSYSGTLTAVLCVGSGPNTTAQFTASFTGESGHPGNIDSMEFGFEGPDRTQFDSGFLSKTLDTDGEGFVLDGIVVKDSSGKSVTMHGTLRCS